jgi:lipoprotein-releasing system permease protein
MAPPSRALRRPALNWPYEWQVGWRFLRGGRMASRNGFLSFISAAAMLGIALGVAALIIVLSVLNGFRNEVRERMLSALAHVEIHAALNDRLPDWAAVEATARLDAQVVGVAPFVAGQALVGRGDEVRAVVVRGVEPQSLRQVLPPSAASPLAALERITPGRSEAVLGLELARQLGVRPGDRVTLVLPPPGAATATPRFVPLTLVGTFELGYHEYDSALVLMRQPDAQGVFGVTGPTGLQLRLADRDRAGELGARLAATLGREVVVRDWTRVNRNWFESLQIQRRMLALILTLIVAVAAFNLVSTLVMTVTDKRADIAILRTLGASPRSVMGIFMVQGAAAGIIGTLSGVVLGLLVALNIDVIVPAIERALGVAFLPGSIYLISRMPSEPQSADIVPIIVISLLLSFIATLYPSWRASRVQPAQALRHE